MSTTASEILEQVKALPADELRELFAKMTQLAAHTPPPEREPRPVAPGQKLWDAEELRAWSKRTWGDRFFTEEEVQEMRDYEDGELER